MAAPDPRRLLAEVADKRQGLRVVDDHQIMVEMHAGRVLEHDLLIDVPLQVGEIDLVALKRVVHLLGDAEEVGPALNHAPSGRYAGCVHQQGERRQDLRHAAAVVGGIDIDDVQVAQGRRLGEDPLHRLRADQALEVLETWQPHRFRRNDTVHDRPARVCAVPARQEDTQTQDRFVWPDERNMPMTGIKRQHRADRLAIL